MAVLVFLLIVAVVALFLQVAALSRRLDQVTQSQRMEADRLDLLIQKAGSLLRPSVSSTPVAPVVAPTVSLPVVSVPPVASPAVEVPSATEPVTTPAAVVAPADSWEVTVATGWLNRVGVLVFVIGLALLVSYAFTRVGPAGRILVGLLTSGALLGTGVALERRLGFRRYGRGLIAGGWAGLYFTTFAMHGVAAARIVESALVATTLLLVVSAAMIAHALTYRSPMVASAAFLVAYATLIISPVTMFSLVATIPLVALVLAVAWKLGWPHLSIVALVATYGTYGWRALGFEASGIDPSGPVPYVLLGVYWLAFEIGDVNGRARPNDHPPSVLLNATGLTLALLMTVAEQPDRVRGTVAAVFSLGYLISTVVRRRSRDSEDRAAFGDAHSALAIAALFATAAADAFTSGVPQTLTMLALTGAMLAAALTLAERPMARIATGLACVASAHGWMVAILFDRPDVAAATAGLLYLSQAAVYRRFDPPSQDEHLWSVTATGLACTALYLSLPPAWQALAGVVLSVALMEAGLRWRSGLRWQGYVTGLGWLYALILAFTMPANSRGEIGLRWGSAPTAQDEWIVLPAAIALMACAALRLEGRIGGHARPKSAELNTASAVAGVFAVSLLVLFEWRVVPSRALTGAWAASALALALGGIVGRVRQARLAGLVLLALCLGKLFLVDASGLDAVARILSFVSLGAILLGISWVYTKYREEIRKYL